MLNLKYKLVTVHTDLRIYCAGRKKVIRECKKTLRRQFSMDFCMLLAERTVT